MKKQLKKTKACQSLSMAIVSVLSGVLALLMPDGRNTLFAQSFFNPLTDNMFLNETQSNLADLVFIACSTRNNVLQTDLRDRCNRLIGASVASNINSPGRSKSAVDNAIEAISPEQVTSFGVTGTRTTASQLRVIGSAIEARLQNLRAGLDSPSSNTGFAVYQQGKVASLGRGGAAGADDSLVSPFGLWANINYQAGDVNSTFVQRGYNFKNGGVTLGADMRLIDDLILGTAFNYLAGDSYFDLSGGRSQTNSYTGSIYASYYVVENFHLDGLATYGGTNYDIQRNIQYVIPGDIVNTQAFGTPGGDQYSLSFGGGYDFSHESFNLNPYARIEYVGLQVDGFQESGGNGWALRIGQQNIHSLKTTLGAQTSYAISTSFGVLLPSFRAEYIHEFMDNSRNFTLSLAGDPLAQPANIVTLKPDRNYAVVGAGLSGTFPYGTSAFLSYDALLGYQNVTSHRVVVGMRIEF
ncbi:MAG: autotransporter outer membrane beta-barrel domain-containing protein [Methylococcales bacterium]